MESNKLIQKYDFRINTIYCGDNLDVLKSFPSDSIDLIYIDPPFFTNKQYELIWNDGFETRSFEDRWEGGIQHYIDWMSPRIEQLHRILKLTGSFYLHCDYHADSYLRILCDRIFGYNNLQNEIVWFYQTGGASKQRFSKNHDIIYWYSKTKHYKYYWDRIKVSRTEKSILRAKNPKGARISSTDTEKNPNDVLIIQQMNPMSKERLGYPTQKPEELIEVFVKASSDENDLVLDSFCGCGTTLAVAKRLKRNYIGIDISPTACKLVATRINYPSGNIIGMPYTIEELKLLSPFEFQNWVVQKLAGRVSEKKSSDLGIDGYIPLEGNCPIQVKQSDKISRPDIDKFETAIKRLKKNKGYFVAFSFTKGAIEEIARCKNQDQLEIVYLTLDDLVNNRSKEKSLKTKTETKE